MLNLGATFDVDYAYAGQSFFEANQHLAGLTAHLYWSYRDQSMADIVVTPELVYSRSKVIWGSVHDGYATASALVTFRVSESSWVRVVSEGRFVGHIAWDPYNDIWGTGNIGTAFGEAGVEPLWFGTDPSIVLPTAGPFSFGPEPGGWAGIDYRDVRYFRLEPNTLYEASSYANLNFTNYTVTADGDHETIAMSYIGLEIIESPFVMGDFNHDGALDGGDVDSFVSALQNMGAYIQSHAPAFEALYPGLGLTVDMVNIFGDFSGDGIFDAGDIDGFVDALVGSRPGVVSAPEACSSLLFVAALIAFGGARRRRIASIR